MTSLELSLVILNCIKPYIFYLQYIYSYGMHATDIRAG